MSTPSLRQLNPAKIIETAQALHSRISERFPSSGLSKVALEVLQVSKEAAERSEGFHRPQAGLRLLAGILMLLILSILAWMFSNYHEFRVSEFGDFIQTLEAGISAVVFTGAAIWFLLNLENRQKRSRALSAIKELHSLAHIVDMHQLTKDPDFYLFKGTNTASSPRRELSLFELARYLDYSTEILSLLGKVSVIYTQNLNDTEVSAATDQLEDLVLGLSTRISQKLASLERIELGLAQSRAASAAT